MDPDDFDRRDAYLRDLRHTGCVEQSATAAELKTWRLDPDFNREERLVLDDIEVRAEVDDAPKPVLESMVDEYRSGVTLQALSDEYGISRETIRGRLKRARVRLRPRGRRPRKRKKRRTR